jgi:hydrogenase small subunit
MGDVLALPPRYASRICRALEEAPQIPVIWLSGQDCAGDSEALLRAEAPSVATLLLDWLLIDYHELLMAAAGASAEQARQQAAAEFPHGYLAVVEGSIPLAEGGAYCTVGGRSFADIVREVCEGALATIAVGACAWDGGLPAAAGGVTRAVGVDEFLKKIIFNLPGCPVNGENLLAVIVHYLTFGELPPTDPVGRPLFAYGTTVHAQCERLAHFKAKRYVREWGDEGHRQGWCLLYMGCKGLYAIATCPRVQFNGATSWSVGAGHPCIGCTTSDFWDAMPPFYRAGKSLTPRPPR